MRLSLGLGLDRHKKVGGLLQKLIKQCGLISANEPLTDKVGKTSRTAYRNDGLAGNGSTYATADWVQTSALWDVEFEVDAKGLDEYILDARASGGIGYIVNNSSDMWQVNSGNITETVKPNGYINILVEDITLSFSVLRLLARTTGASAWTNELLWFKLTNKSTGVTYTPNFNSRQSDGIIPINGSDGSVILGEQFLSPATPTQPNLAKESDQDKYGVTVADGNQYLDSALTVQCDIGLPIAHNPLTGKIFAWVSDGAGGSRQPSVSEYGGTTGRIKMNLKQIDGIVDGMDENGSYLISGTGTTIVGTLIHLVQDSGNEFVEFGTSLEDSKEYTLVYYISNTNLDGNLIMSEVGGTVIQNPLAMPKELGENRFAFTTRTTISNNRIKCVLSGTNGTFVDVDFKAIYEGDKTTGDLPESGQVVSGNSIIRDQSYFDESYTDFWYDNGEPKVVPVDDVPDNYMNQVFSSVDRQKILTYQAPISGECETKTLKYLGFNMAALAIDSDGAYAVDTSGSYAYEEEV